MIQLQINEKRDFIKHLFLSELFDSFLLEEATIKVANTYSIDGRINKDFYTNEEFENNPSDKQEFSSWAELKAFCFDLIKGKKTPLYFKFVLHFDKSKLPTEPSIKSYVLTIKFQDQVVVLTSGISTHTFSLDKSPDEYWDSYLEKLLRNANISFEHM